MYSLFIDTHDLDLVIALYKDKQLKDKEIKESLRNHSDYTMPIIDEIINDITCDIKDYITIKDRYEAIKYAINTYPSQDIYILGKGDETYIEENNLKIPFNDKNCVLNIINK